MFKVVKCRINRDYNILHKNYVPKYNEEVVFKGTKKKCKEFVGQSLQSFYNSRALCISQTF